MFVDFDNVYTGMMAVDPPPAKRFAEDQKEVRNYPGSHRAESRVQAPEAGAGQCQGPA